MVPGADLLGTDLLGADLLGTDLLGTDLLGTDLLGTDLLGTDLVSHRYQRPSKQAYTRVGKGACPPRLDPRGLAFRHHPGRPAMLIALPEVDRTCEEVCYKFLGTLDYLVLRVLLGSDVHVEETGVSTRLPMAEAHLSSMIGITSCTLKAALTRLRCQGLVVALNRSSSSSDASDTDEKGYLWGVNSETMADAVVFKLDAMTPKKPALRKAEVKFVCCKCGLIAKEVDIADSMNEACTAFLCTDYSCMGEMEEAQQAEEQEAHEAVYAMRGYLQGLCTGIQRALVLYRLDA